MAKATVRRQTSWGVDRSRLLAAAQGDLFAGTSWHLVTREETGRETTLEARADLHDARLVVRLVEGTGPGSAVELELTADIPWLDARAAQEALEAWLASFDDRARKLRES